MNNATRLAAVPRPARVTATATATVTRLVQTDDPAILPPHVDARIRDDLGVVYVRASLSRWQKREAVRDALANVRARSLRC